MKRMKFEDGQEEDGGLSETGQKRFSPFNTDTREVGRGDSVASPGQPIVLRLCLCQRSVSNIGIGLGVHYCCLHFHCRNIQPNLCVLHSLLVQMLMVLTVGTFSTLLKNCESGAMLHTIYLPIGSARRLRLFS